MRYSIVLIVIFILIAIFLLFLNSKNETLNHKLDKKESSLNGNLQCVSSCGVLIMEWDNAKRYCSQRNMVLASKTQIKKAIEGKTEDCLDCNYWTSTEALLKKGQKTQKKQVVIYLNFENDFLDYPIDSTYIATCISK